MNSLADNYNKSKFDAEYERSDRDKVAAKRSESFGKDAIDNAGMDELVQADNFYKYDETNQPYDPLT